MPGSVPNAQVTKLSVVMPRFGSVPSDTSVRVAQITAGCVRDTANMWACSGSDQGLTGASITARGLLFYTSLKKTKKQGPWNSDFLNSNFSPTTFYLCDIRQVAKPLSAFIHKFVKIK